MLPDDHAGSAVVITGMGLAASLGLDTPAVWKAITAGRVGFGPINAVESPLPVGATGGQATDLPCEFHPECPREARYLRWAVEQALRNAEALGRYPSARCAAILGTTLHGIRAGGRYLRSGDPEELRSFLAGATLRLAIEGLGIEGPSVTTCSACSSSLGAVALGTTILQSGQADLVVAGGYDAIGEYVWAGFNSLRLTSPGVVRPFARGREGMKVGEGFGILILERRADAERRGQPIRAVVEGWGESADAHHLTQPHPQGEGAAKAMGDALARAGAAPALVGFVAAHATGTPDNDASEYQALKTVFSSRLVQTPVVGFKSYLGHTLGGAGAVELILSVCALETGHIPACANVPRDDVEFPDLCIAPPDGLRRPLARAMNMSLGFGGANTCVVLARPDVRRTAPPPLLPVSDAWITGIGLILPGISSARALADRLAGDTGPLFENSTGRTIDDTQLSQHLNARRLRRIAPSVKLLLTAASAAATDARLEANDAFLARASAIIASMHGSLGLCCEYYTQIVREGLLRANPVLFAEGVPNAAAAHLSVNLGVRGGCQTIIGTRNAGLDALGLASLRIRTGASEIVLVGACEEISPALVEAYRYFGLHRREDESGPGFVAIPGAVALVVESAALAQRRGARPWARIDSWAAAGQSRSGPAGAVAHVLSDLAPFEHIVVSRNETWIDRAERLALRRVAPSASIHSVSQDLGELFSAGPLVGIAWALAGTDLPNFAAIGADFSGGASGVMIARQTAHAEPSRA